MLSFVKINCEICTFTKRNKMRMIKMYRKSILLFICRMASFYLNSIYDSEMIPHRDLDNFIGILRMYSPF